MAAVTRKATRIDLFSVATPQMRAFHLTWMAFFVCFFAWFAVAPLMPVIKGVFGLSRDQIANIGIASVGITIFARLAIGPLCDRFGPRKTYVALLALGAIPVMGIAFATSYQAFLVFRLAIGAIGASFVITQFHTSVMFAPNVVGTANATVGGWGNAGGGATQTVMPLIVAALASLGVEQAFGWRLAMVVPGLLMLVVAVLYWRYTQDAPEGNFSDLRARGIVIASGKPGAYGKAGGWAAFRQAMVNYRVWLLALAYAGSFGLELFIHAQAAIFFHDRYQLTLTGAGLAVGAFGGLALFARALGGIGSDRIARRFGLGGRTVLLVTLLAGEGVMLLVFSGTAMAGQAIAAMMLFGLFTHMSCGAIYAVVPFVDRAALGGVAGIVGAGGNVGAVAAGFLFKYLGSVPQTLYVLGWCVLGCAVGAATIRFSPGHRAAERALLDAALAEREAMPPGGAAQAA